MSGSPCDLGCDETWVCVAVARAPKERCRNAMPIRQPIPAQRIECGFGSSACVSDERAILVEDAWIRTAQTGAAYSTSPANGSEKCAASDRAKISLLHESVRSAGTASWSSRSARLRRRRQADASGIAGCLAIASQTYLISTSAPASLSFFAMSSASVLLTPTLTSLGAPSTRSLASLRPRPVTSRTTLMTPILLRAAGLEDDGELGLLLGRGRGGAPPRPRARPATATGAALTPHLSSSAFVRLTRSMTVRLREVLDDFVVERSPWCLSFYVRTGVVESRERGLG